MGDLCGIAAHRAFVGTMISQDGTVQCDTIGVRVATRVHHVVLEDCKCVFCKVQHIRGVEDTWTVHQSIFYRVWRGASGLVSGDS